MTVEPHLQMIDGVWHAGPCSTCGGFHRVVESQVGDGYVRGDELVLPISVRVEPCPYVQITITLTKADIEAAGGSVDGLDDPEAP